MPNYQKFLIGFVAASIAALTQLVFWDFFKPLIWVLFYPAAFIAASFGGLVCGLTTGFFALFYVFFFFVEPSFTFSSAKLGSMQTAIIFLPVIYLIGDLQERYRRLRNKLADELRLSEKERVNIVDLYEKSLVFGDIKFNVFADSLPQIVWATDAAGSNVYFNSAWMDYTGLTLQESLGAGWNTPFHPEDKQRAWEAWQNATQHLAEYSLECRLRKSDGTYRWWLIRGVPVKSPSGKVINWFGTCTDIHDIKQTYADLAEEKSKLQTIFDNSPDGLAIVGVDGKFTLVNERFISYFGLDAESDFLYSYRQILDLLEILTVQGEVLPEEKYPTLRAFTGESVLSQEILLRNKNTGRKWYGSHSTMPIKDKNGVVTGVVISVRDITNEIEDEVKLLNLLNDQNLILNSGIAGLAKTKGRKFLWINDVFAKNFGYTAEELSEQSSRVLYPSEKAFEDFGKKVGQAGLGESNFVRETLQLKRKDGSLGWFLVGGGPTTKGSDESIWMSIDVTQDRRNQELLEAYLRRIEKSMNETLIVLSKTVEMHDPYTAGHQLRVGEIAKEIGKVMGLSEEKAENLRLMGLIHDIGKIGIPAEILSKPGKLSNEELVLVRAHTKIGYEILKNVNFEIPVADVAYQHHERLDGSGYPNALKNANILLESRIIAVADVVEAMSSHRPYRPSLGLGRALEEIQQGRGVKYDAEVVDACLKLFNENGYKLESDGS